MSIYVYAYNQSYRKSTCSFYPQFCMHTSTLQFYLVIIVNPQIYHLSKSAINSAIIRKQIVEISERRTTKCLTFPYTRHKITGYIIVHISLE